ncbi:hypothetical protein JY651_08070 [Pyxidicoccus parkwayensis]|uniref:Uncharacterized protein n=1 Tax=Pyxidicoccus parkwayensis TaxID=2813578 RepID=A0ABX7P346_9BACT|nr:hypothetical protein [Pyxidicoccus parkwaysis]QSQ24883.1 hypothetical protein JY651_08070 [Pyxidicoccus parkwaysis]
MSAARLGGPIRYTREGRGVFHLPVARPWTWAVTHHDADILCFTEVGNEGRPHAVHLPEALLGCWVALYATREYNAAGAEWLRTARGLEAPAGDVLPAGCYVAVGRLAEVSTVGNDLARATAPGSWWWPPVAPCRGTVAWWLEEVQVFEPLEAAPAPALSLVDAELLPELRERARLARDGVWRPEVYPVPATLPVDIPVREEPPAPQRPPAHPRPVVDDMPVPPMLHVEQLGLFGDVGSVKSPAPAATPAPEARTKCRDERQRHSLPTCNEPWLISEAGIRGDWALPPAPSERQCAEHRELGEAAKRLRALLADGVWHTLAEVHTTVGPERVYRVTCWGGSPGPPDAHQVPVALRSDGQGGCWYAAWPGAPAC